MDIIFGIVLILIGIGLLYSRRRNYKAILDYAASIATILAFLVAVYLLVKPAISSTPPPTQITITTPLFSQTFIPSITTTNTLTFTPSIPTTNTLTFTPSIPTTNTLTLTPTLSSTPNVDLGISENCINAQFWTFYGPAISPDVNNCLHLDDFGFEAQDGGLHINPFSTSASETHAIYSPISEETEISFVIQISKIQTGYANEANIGFGIVPSDPINPSGGIFLVYHYIPNYPNVTYPMRWQGGKYYGLNSDLIFGKTQKVTVLIQGIHLTVSLDDEVVINKIEIPFKKGVFWIDYFLPVDSEITGFISNFSVQEK